MTTSEREIENGTITDTTGGTRNTVKWIDRLDEIRGLVNGGATVNDLMVRYGISKARLYQVLSTYGIETLKVGRVKYLDEFTSGKSPAEHAKYVAVSKALARAGLDKDQRLTYFRKYGIPDDCPILGIKLDYDIYLDSRNVEKYGKQMLSTGGKILRKPKTLKDGLGKGENSPTIMRIDLAKGFNDVDNVMVVSWRACRLRNDGTADEHQRIVDFLNNCGVVWGWL